jgi:ABC-type glycerol-3-phosphate transport system substrate-binding protein
MPDDMLKDIDLDNKFVPAIKQSLDFDGKLYGLSPVVNTLMLYINKSVTAQVLSEFNQSDAATNAEQADKVNTLLNSTPQTWTEFADFANLVTKKNGDQIVRSGVALGTSQNVTISEDPLYAMMLQNGTAMTSNDLQTATFNLPSSGGSDIPGKRALDFLASFSKPGSANYSWNGSMPKDIEAFATGKTAMVFAYESFANYMDQNYPNVEYSQSALPQIGGADEKIVDFARFNALVVPGLTKFPQEAWEVVSAVSTEHATDFSSALKITTSQKDNAMIKVLKDRAGNSDVGSFQAQTAVTWNKGRYPLNIDSIFTTMINNVSSSGQDTKAALDTAASQVTQILRKTTW